MTDKPMRISISPATMVMLMEWRVNSKAARKMAASTLASGQASLDHMGVGWGWKGGGDSEGRRAGEGCVGCGLCGEVAHAAIRTAGTRSHPNSKTHPAPRLKVLSVFEPPRRKTGVKVASVAELVTKLKTEAKVI